MNNNFLNIMSYKRPAAAAYIVGSDRYKDIRGITKFFSAQSGVLVYSEIYGLPDSKEMPFKVFACHIHGGGSCTGNAQDPFADAKMHYNPDGALHPYHDGDLPPLFSNHGFAWNTVFTSRFQIDHIIGKTVIIHDKADDFTSQPSGDSGDKIACGVIIKL